MSSPLRKFLTIITLVAGLVWIWYSRVTPLPEGTGESSAPHPGFLAPDFELSGSDGAIYRLSDLRGKPVIINFWASWCAPCKAEMPAIERVHQGGKDQGLVVLAISATNQDNQADALAFLQRIGIGFPILFDKDGNVFRLYGVRALPTTFFVDTRGVIQDVVVGGPMSEALLRIRAMKIMEAKP